MVEAPFSMADVLGVISEAPSSHPVVTVLQQESPQIQTLMNRVERMHSAEGTRFIARNLGFLADAIRRIGEFTLEPLDLVAIGVQLDRLPHSRSSHVDTPTSYVTHIMGTTYAIHGISNPGWADLPKYYLENLDNRDKLSPAVLNDRAGLLQAQQRNNNIGTSLDRLKKVVYAENIDRLPVIDGMILHLGHDYSMMKWELQAALAKLKIG